MSSYTFKIHGRNIKFKAASMTQALFARDHHLAHLREKARGRASVQRVKAKVIAKWPEAAARFKARSGVKSFVESLDMEKVEARVAAYLANR